MPGRPDRQQVRTRQLTLIAGAIVVFILLVLAFKGCLDQRKERAFKNYASDLSAIVVESEQLSSDFFSALGGGGDTGGDVGFESEVNGLRGTASSLAERAAGLDAPDELAGAQQQVALSFQLRSDAISTIADQIPNANGDQGSNKAIKQIAEQMKTFLASDVLYARAASAIDQELVDQEIVVDGGVPKSEFLPTGGKNPNYLDLAEVQALLSGAGVSAGGSGGGAGGASCDPGDDLSHGLGLLSVAASPSLAALTPDVANTVPSSDTELSATIQNQGEADETEIKLTVEGDFTATQSVPSLAAGEQTEVTIPLKPTPTAGDTGSVTVTVEPVCGEQVEDNNTFSYDLTFE